MKLWVKRSLMVLIVIAGGLAMFPRVRDWELRKAISSYRGDGTISYKKASILGISECTIKMPNIDLSKKIDVTYNLNGIPPKRDRYVIYLVVPEPAPIEEVFQGSCNFIVIKNDMSTVFSSTIKDLTNSSGQGENRFYYRGKGYLNVTNNGFDWKLKVTCENNVLSKPVNAYIMISSGGNE